MEEEERSLGHTLADLVCATCTQLWLGGYSRYFGYKHGVNSAGLSRIGLQRLLTPQKQYAFLLFLLSSATCKKWRVVCEGVEQQLCHKGLFSEMWSLEEMLKMFVLLSFLVLRWTFISLQPNLALHVKCSEPNSYQRRALKFSILPLITELEATFITIMLFKQRPWTDHESKVYWCFGSKSPTIATLDLDYSCHVSYWFLKKR